MLNNYRISKYNPENRNKSDEYNCKNEWTHISDFANEYKSEYYLIENYYIDVIMHFCKMNNIKEVTINELEINIDNYNDIDITGINIDILNNLNVTQNIILDDLPTIIKSILREYIWGKISGENNLYIHFGYDLYVYIGSNNKVIVSNLPHINNQIFIENFSSPYMD